MKEEAKSGEGNEWSKKTRSTVAAIRNWTGAERRKYEMGEWEYGRIR